MCGISGFLDTSHRFGNDELQATVAEMETKLYAMMAELGGMEVPLNAPLGASSNKRLGPRGGDRAADFPKAMVLEKPLNATAK